MFVSPVDIGAAMSVGVLALVALAAREDLVRHRVPNKLNAAGWLCGVALATLAGGSEGLIDSVAGTLVGFAALFPFYWLRGMGAGDVKLMAAAGAFLGPLNALLAAGISLVVGAVLAVVLLVRRLAEPRVRLGAATGDSAPTGWWVAATLSTVRKERFPYAVAVGAGVAVTVCLRGSLGTVLAAMGMS